MYDSNFSTFLFGRPSYAEGVARLLDFGGTLNQYNTTKNGISADLRALRADWNAVGQDVAQAAFNDIRHQMGN